MYGLVQFERPPAACLPVGMDSRNSNAAILLRSVLHKFSAAAPATSLDGTAYRRIRPKARKSNAALLLPAVSPVTPLLRYSYKKMGVPPSRPSTVCVTQASARVTRYVHPVTTSVAYHLRGNSQTPQESPFVFYHLQTLFPVTTSVAYHLQKRWGGEGTRLHGFCREKNREANRPSNLERIPAARGKVASSRITRSDIQYSAGGRHGMQIIEKLEATRDETLELFQLSDSELDRSYGPGKWTARFVLHHLADAETVLFDRIRRVLSEGRGVIWAFDQDRGRAAWITRGGRSGFREIFTSPRARGSFITRRFTTTSTAISSSFTAEPASGL